ncbi:hypothetical protein J6590_022308 [Homalodisca vitripennis]|nr:hypothetical protein J6590_022308 [Homalodisca vitripennis]
MFIRLPTVTAPSALYATSFLSLLRTTHECPSNGDLYAMGPELRALEWQTRLRELQGALIFAGILQTLLGISGLQARLCRVLSPVAVAPAVILAGLTLVQDSISHLTEHWILTAGSESSRRGTSDIKMCDSFVAIITFILIVHFKLKGKNSAHGVPK